MLQRDYNSLIDKFYEDVEKLNFKTPVADIQNKMKVSKGNVSSILNKKIKPSEGFINKFYESFKIELQRFDNDKDKSRLKEEPAPYQTGTTETIPLSEHCEMLKQHYEDMKQINNRLLSTMEKDVSGVQVSLRDMNTRFLALTKNILLNQESVLRHFDLPVAPVRQPPAHKSGIQQVSYRGQVKKGDKEGNSHSSGK